MNVKDMALQVSGPFPCRDDEPEEQATHFYRLRFWSVAEYGDDFVAIVTVNLPRNRLVCIASEHPLQSDFLDNVIMIYEEEREYTPLETNYYGKISDLLFWFEAEFDNGRAKPGLMLWRELEEK